MFVSFGDWTDGDFLQARLIEIIRRVLRVPMGIMVGFSD
jgi:hypothetical protein